VGAPVIAGQAVAGNVVYVLTADDHPYFLDALGCRAVDCPPLWTANPGGPVKVQPAVAGGLVFTGSTDGCCLTRTASMATMTRSAARPLTYTRPPRS
jgi:PQQ-like domain